MYLNNSFKVKQPPKESPDTLPEKKIALLSPLLKAFNLLTGNIPS